EELVESQHSIVIRDSMILCAFAKGATPDDVMVQAWKATTGEDCTWDDLMDRARVQWDQARQWNVEHWARQGKSAAQEDLLSWRLRREPIPSGVAAGMVSFVDDEDEAGQGKSRDDEDEAACMSAYYKLRGWNAEGLPVLG
ncbi:MAG: aldehyde ferredoxin oxidoreductase C-terminal domain-containing protein, partial [Poseidonia sp.]